MGTQPTNESQVNKIIIVVLIATAIFMLKHSISFRSCTQSSPVQLFNNTDQIAQESTSVSPHPTTISSIEFKTPYLLAKGKKESMKVIKEREMKGIKSPVILIWHTEARSAQKRDSQMEFVLGQQCGGCVVTTNRSTLEESIAVLLYNHAGLKKDFDMPDSKLRNPHQVYVFWSRETPEKSFSYKSILEDPRFDSIFNLTFYFRRDADIQHYFGNIELALRTSKRQYSSPKELMKQKSKLAVWLVSDCFNVNGAIQRLQYAKDLVEAGLKLDKFGKCFNNRYEGKLSKLLKGYKFYLAFENSVHCPDYLTEKFWRNSLESGLVPIVWGPTKEDVEAVAPANSFIHAEDYESPRKLVEYLDYLDKNDEAYMEYHKWRLADIDRTIPIEDIDRGHQASICRLCKRQVLEHHPPKMIPSVSKWMYNTRYVDEKCLVGKQHLKIKVMKSLINF